MLSFLDKIKKFPTSPGIYQFFDRQKKVIYVGKAASLKDRVRSYFSSPFFVNKGEGRPIEKMIEQVVEVKIKKTDTVLEAYFLEQKLIKQLQPKYNVMGKDDKSASYVCLTREKFPRWVIVRATDLIKIKETKNFFQLSSAKYQNLEFKKSYGPFASKHSLVTALKILRKIFPYHDRLQKTEKGCLGFQIGLCPGPYAGAITVKEYGQNIRGIEMVFQGKKKSLLKKLEREMKALASQEKFEEAIQKRNQIFALQHVQDTALIEREKIKRIEKRGKIWRIEAFDVSNIAGCFCVGAMAVFEGKDGFFQPSKSQYRKFKIKSFSGIDDVMATREMLQRRFRNNWPLPDLILLDGGKGHFNMAVALEKELRLKIPLLAIAKGPTRKASDFQFIETEQFLVSKSQKKFLREMIKKKNLLEQINGEAHRFAISYHRWLRAGLGGER